jgi:D-sedoheptulose 7-phosphate isomerase
MNTDWLSQVATISNLLKSLEFTWQNGSMPGSDSAFEYWRDKVLALRSNLGTVYMVGNGASASMASHFAADLAKNARVHTEVFSDLSLITAISNDMGYENVFAEPLRRRGKPGDMLVAISSSGQSPNVLAAVQVACDLEMEIVTLSAFAPDNPLRRSGDLNAYVPANSYGLAETCHAAILHHWLDTVVDGTNSGSDKHQAREACGFALGLRPHG